jgi:hypothetical protein
MPRYIRAEDVRLRLIGKVRFTDDPEDENRMPNGLLTRLIDEAEGQVEMDLSPRYESPFITEDGQRYEKLPERPTRNYLRTMCELMSVIRVLETDFGSGTIVNGEAYAQKQQERYDLMLKKLMEKKGGDSYQNWAHPPLPGLRLAPHNYLADDGYSGQILHTTQGDGDFPSTRINDPSETFWRFDWDE